MNDNNPAFDEESLQVQVLENEKPRLIVGTVRTTDSDEGDIAKLGKIYLIFLLKSNAANIKDWNKNIINKPSDL